MVQLDNMLHYLRNRQQWAWRPSTLQERFHPSTVQWAAMQRPEREPGLLGRQVRNELRDERMERLGTVHSLVRGWLANPVAKRGR